MALDQVCNGKNIRTCLFLPQVLSLVSACNAQARRLEKLLQPLGLEVRSCAIGWLPADGWFVVCQSSWAITICVDTELTYIVLLSTGQAGGAGVRQPPQRELVSAQHRCHCGHARARPDAVSCAGRGLRGVWTGSVGCGMYKSPLLVIKGVGTERLACALRLQAQPQVGCWSGPHTPVQASCPHG